MGIIMIYKPTNTAGWFQRCFLFSIIYGIILAIDELIFLYIFSEGLKPPTSILMLSFVGSSLQLYELHLH